MLTTRTQAIYALNRGDVFEAYHLYLQAGMHSAAHELAVFDLAPEAVIRNDLELLKVLFERLVGHTVDGWHVRGKVCSKIYGTDKTRF
jgi:nuclear pore complex protein Nup98-Nup96